jgi:hypothetical protein
VSQTGQLFFRPSRFLGLDRSHTKALFGYRVIGEPDFSKPVRSSNNVKLCLVSWNKSRISKTWLPENLKNEFYGKRLFYVFAKTRFLSSPLVFVASHRVGESWLPSLLKPERAHMARRWSPDRRRPRGRWSRWALTGLRRKQIIFDLRSDRRRLYASWPAGAAGRDQAVRLPVRGRPDPVPRVTSLIRDHQARNPRWIISEFN